MESINGKWIYNYKIVTEEDVPKGAVGMVYRIAKYPNAQQAISPYKYQDMPWESVYIGKKLLHSTRKSKVGVRAQKKQLEETGDKRRVKKVKRVTKDSGWLQYNSSCKPLQEEIKQHPELFLKEILHWTYSKKETSYMEIHEQVLHDVLRKPSFNETIAGTYYRRDLVKPTDNDKE